MNNLVNGLVEMILKDCQPLSIVKTLNKQYILQSMIILSYRKIPEKYKAAATKLNIENMAFSSDIWTSDTNVAYITATIHFILNVEMRSQV